MQKTIYFILITVYELNFYLKHGFDKDYSDYSYPYVQAINI